MSRDGCQRQMHACTTARLDGDIKPNGKRSLSLFPNGKHFALRPGAIPVMGLKSGGTLPFPADGRVSRNCSSSTEIRALQTPRFVHHKKGALRCAQGCKENFFNSSISSAGGHGCKIRCRACRLPRRGATAGTYWSVTTSLPLMVLANHKSAAAGLWRLFTYPFRTVSAAGLYRDVLYGAVRAMLKRITIPQARYLNPTTSARYAEHCQKHNLEQNTIQIQTKNGEVSAHWVGNPDAETVILYFHGGGYTHPASEGYFLNAQRLVEEFKDEQKFRSVAFLILAYSLAPEATHPTQLTQAAATLTHLIDNTGRDPSKIFISGDSAGGNIALALLSHVLHPHAAVPVIKLQKPLGGALLYSPWAGFNTDYSSFTENFTMDMLSPPGLRRASAMFLGRTDLANSNADPGPVTGDAWTDTCRNPASWWHDLSRVVSDVFIVYGDSEILLGPIKDLERTMKKGWAESNGDPSRMIFLEGIKEAHIAPIIDIMTPDKDKKSNTQLAIEEWYKARLRK